MLSGFKNFFHRRLRLELSKLISSRSRRVLNDFGSWRSELEKYGNVRLGHILENFGP